MPDAYNPWGAPVFPTADDNAMQPETFVPQGVRDWTQQAAPKDYNILSQIAGSLGKALMYPGQVAQSQTPISTEDMVGPAFNLAGMLTLGAGAAPQEANALNMGIKAYHGSPHDFDKFDLSKIGTGEGAQAYGHGLYFADQEATAKAYRDALTPYDPPHSTARWAMEEAGNDPAGAIQKLKGSMDWRKANGGLSDAEAAKHAEAIKLIESGAHNGRMYEVNINADPSHFLDWDKPLSQQSDTIKQALRLGELPTKPTPEETMAVFKKAKELGVPPNSLPEYKALEARMDSANAGAWENFGVYPSNVHTRPEDMTGAQLYQAWEQGKLGPHQLTDARSPAVADRLREAGIPGIKYLDEGSRNPWDVRQNQKGFYASEVLGPGYGGRRSDEYFPTHEAAQQWADKQQTRNYVVFNHDLIDIMRKYAVPGMLGAPILANALSEQKT